MPNNPFHTKSPKSALWGALQPGAYTAGFRSFMTFDYARIYDLDYKDHPDTKIVKKPRPMLVNIWYPAEVDESGGPMRYREYLAIQSKEPLLADFSRRLIEFTMRVLTQEVLDKLPEEMNAEEKQALENFLDTETAAFLNAVPVDRKFPLVLNHQGLGGGFEDNTVLYEFLASHGYVVANSAFQSENPAWLNIDWDIERSDSDLDFLVNLLHDQPNVDWQHIGVIGQSYGGQAAIAWAAGSNSPADAVVSLDATIEYMSTERFWNETRPLHTRMKQSKSLTVPMLLYTQARHKGHYDIYDTLKYAERYYARAAHLRHNDFLSHGAVGSQIRRSLRPQDAELEPIRQVYDLVCLHTLHFLNAYLKGDTEGLAFLQARRQSGHAEESLLSLEYRPADLRPPDAKHVLDVALSEGVEPALERCRPFGEEIEAGTLLQVSGALLDRGKPEAALPIAHYNTDLFPTLPFGWERLGEVYRALGDRQKAIQAYKTALDRLESENLISTDKEGQRQELLYRLRELEAET